MDQVLKFGDYTFTKIDEDSFADLKEVTESVDSHGQAKMFEWVLAKQKWFFLYIVRYQGEIIGRVEIKTINHAVPFYELGYEVKSSQRNKEHGTTIVNHITEYLRDSMLAKRVQAVVGVDNKPSNALMRKASLYKLEATLENYALTIEHDPCDANIYSAIF